MGKMVFFAVNHLTTNQHHQTNVLLVTTINDNSKDEESSKVPPLAIAEDLTDSENDERKVVTEKSQNGDINSSNIHLLSTLSGPLLTCAVASLYIYVPTHSILKEPSYWYEHELLTIIAVLPAFFGLTLLHGKLEF